MKGLRLLVAAIFGATGVALGALGAHFLKRKMQDGLISTDQLAAFDTASKYQLLHTLAIILVILIQGKNPDKRLSWVYRLFVSGILLFSGSIYLLSTRELTGIGGAQLIGPLTPLGGICFIGGWIVLGLFGINLHKSEK